MSEFSETDVMKWIQTALKTDSSIDSAIYYDNFFACKRDPQKFERAKAFFTSVMKEKGLL